jgi:hypothetical protein
VGEIDSTHPAFAKQLADNKIADERTGSHAAFRDGNRIAAMAAGHRLAGLEIVDGQDALAVNALKTHRTRLSFLQGRDEKESDSIYSRRSSKSRQPEPCEIFHGLGNLRDIPKKP